jgi:hypothetical protein
VELEARPDIRAASLAFNELMIGAATPLGMNATQPDASRSKYALCDRFRPRSLVLTSRRNAGLSEPLSGIAELEGVLLLLLLLLLLVVVVVDESAMAIAQEAQRPARARAGRQEGGETRIARMTREHDKQQTGAVKQTRGEGIGKAIPPNPWVCCAWP